jgi:hypothetical protein
MVIASAFPHRSAFVMLLLSSIIVILLSHANRERQGWHSLAKRSHEGA